MSAILTGYVHPTPATIIVVSQGISAITSSAISPSSARRGTARVSVAPWTWKMAAGVMRGCSANPDSVYRARAGRRASAIVEAVETMQSVRVTSVFTGNVRTRG